MKRFLDVSLKIRMNIVILSLLIILLTALGFYIYNEQKRITLKEADERMYSQLDDLCSVMQVQVNEKQKDATKMLSVFHEIFYRNGSITEFPGSYIPVEARNQVNDDVQEINIPLWQHGGQVVYNNNVLVDKIKSLGGEAAAIFERVPQGFVRVSTNIVDTAGDRIINTYIPHSSVVVKAIEQGKKYNGRAFVVNDWYITAYEPIFVNKKVKGMLFTGTRERDMASLKKIFEKQKIL